MIIQKPEVFILKDNGIGIANFTTEFLLGNPNKSGNKKIKSLYKILSTENITANNSLSLKHDIEEVLNDESSNALKKIFQEQNNQSILNDIKITYFIKNISYGVLFSFSRNNLPNYISISPKESILRILDLFIFTYNQAKSYESKKRSFSELIKNLDLFIFDKTEVNFIKQEADYIFNQLMLYLDKYKYDGLTEKIYPKNEIDKLVDICGNIDSYESFIKTFSKIKKRKDASEHFRTLITCNWKTEIILTVNINELNKLILNNENTDFYQFKVLIEAIKDKTPSKYLDLLSMI